MMDADGRLVVSAAVDSHLIELANTRKYAVAITPTRVLDLRLTVRGNGERAFTGCGLLTRTLERRSRETAGEPAIMKFKQRCGKFGKRRDERDASK